MGNVVALPGEVPRDQRCEGPPARQQARESRSNELAPVNLLRSAFSLQALRYERDVSVKNVTPMTAE